MLAMTKKNNNIVKCVAVMFTLCMSSYINNANEYVSNCQFGFQKPASPVFEGIVAFHDDPMIFLCLILGFVLYILITCLIRFRGQNNTTERLVDATVLEIV